jgi:hypothetical protein
MLLRRSRTRARRDLGRPWLRCVSRLYAYAAVAGPTAAFMADARADDASSEGKCLVSMSPDSAGNRWHSAAVALRRLLRDGGGTGIDCRAVAIWLEADGATVVFTTQDGRQAMRRLQSPEELAPVVEALRVTLQPVPTPPLPPQSSGAAPPLAEAPVAARAQPTPVFLLQSAVGARLSGPGSFVSAVLTIRAGVDVRGWPLPSPSSSTSRAHGADGIEPDFAPCFLEGAVLRSWKLGSPARVQLNPGLP